MRQIGSNDINQILLTRLYLGRDGEQSDEMQRIVAPGLVVQINEQHRNEIVRQLIGHLSYRSREQIVRTLDSLTGWREGVDAPSLDLIDFWSRFADEHLEYRDAFYVRWDKFENWRRAYHALDEDLPCLCWLVQNELQNVKTEDQLFQRLKPWPTFLHGDDDQLYRELSRGMASLHLHVSGSYPAPFYWLALMVELRWDGSQCAIVIYSFGFEIFLQLQEAFLKAVVRFVELLSNLSFLQVLEQVLE